MPRDGNGNYTLPLPPVVADTTIESTVENSTNSDLAQALTDSLSRSGSGGMQTQLGVVDGNSSDAGLKFISETQSGFYRASAGDVRCTLLAADQWRVTATGFQYWDHGTGMWATPVSQVELSDLDGAVVKLTGDQEIAGVKTFTDSPIIKKDNPSIGFQDATATNDWFIGALITDVLDDGFVIGTTASLPTGEFRLTSQTLALGDPTLQASFTIHRFDNDSSLALSGGDAGSNGLNINLFGEMHPSRAWDFEMRKNTTVLFEYDDSADLFTFHQTVSLASGMTVGTGDGIVFSNPAAIWAASNTAGIRIGGGDNSFSGGNIFLQGGAHPTLPGVTDFYNGTVLEMRLDGAANVLDVQGNGVVTTGKLQGGRGKILENLPAISYRSPLEVFSWYAGANVNDGTDGGFVIGQGIQITGGTARFVIDNLGRVVIGDLSGTGNRAVYSTPTGILTNSASDARLKESVWESEYGLSEVLEMNPITYRWKDKARGEQTELGFIAQDMQKLVPEVVGENSDGMLSLDYPKLVAVMARAIQELEARVAELEG